MTLTDQSSPTTSSLDLRARGSVLGWTPKETIKHPPNNHKAAIHFFPPDISKEMLQMGTEAEFVLCFWNFLAFNTYGNILCEGG